MGGREYLYLPSGLRKWDEFWPNRKEEPQGARKAGASFQPWKVCFCLPSINTNDHLHITCIAAFDSVQ